MSTSIVNSDFFTFQSPLPIIPLFQDVDIGKLASDVKLLKDCVKAQERKIKLLEEKVAEFEKQADQSDESDDDAKIGNGDDAGSDHA